MFPMSCPSRDVLSNYVLGKVSEETLEATAAHIGACASCQTSIQKLEFLDSLVSQLRKPAPRESGLDDPELQQLLSQAKAVVTGKAAVLVPTVIAPGGKVSQGPPDLGQIDEYRLLEKIGQGGMGAVYKALHVRLEKRVALKVLPADRTKDSQAIARFQREMRAVGKLDHPNIVRATDAGEADGVHFLVMELIEGIDLQKLLKRIGRLSLADACELARQAALGLQHAHEHGLIHRDIKPSNLILGLSGQVKILDLGLARLHAEHSSHEDLTPTGQTMGTLDYLAPEQASDAKSVDIRADIYSLGCTLYHLLAGQPPFSGPAFAHPAAKLAAHLHKPFPPITNERSEVPEELARILERMTAKSPASRFAAPAQVAEALQPLSAGCNVAGLLAAADLQPAPERRAEGVSPPVSAGLDTPGRHEFSTFSGGIPGEKPKQHPKQECPPSAPVGTDPIPVLSLRQKRRHHFVTLLAASIILVVGLSFVVYFAAIFEKKIAKVAELSEARNPPAPGEVDKKKRETSGADNAHATVPADVHSLARQGYNVLKTHCYRCHGIDFKVPGFNVLDRSILIAPRGENEPPYVVSGKPEQSYVWQRVAVKGDMPPKGPKPSEADKQVLKKWIETGAPFPSSPPRAFKSEKDILSAIRDHLRKTNPNDRKFQRYFTLTHLYNNRSVTDEDQRLYRAALAKLANSLSWKPSLVVPAAVDREETVYNIDLRRLGWDEHELWKEVLKAYPYGLTHSQDADESLRNLAQEVYDLAGNELPYLRADWFIATASRPPLYHSLLRLPASALALERQLQVDPDKDFLNNRLARAGLLTSGVSKQNRLLDRHEALHGVYWKSYDFKNNEGAGNLVKYPLGPAFEGNPFPKQAFEHAGGEIIFTLPNGLQGYLLVDAAGRRLDEGPIAVVRDAQETAGTPAIVNGLSCMACHKHGLVPFEDKLRTGSAVAGDALIKVQELFSKKEEMDRLVERDQKRFLGALEEAAGGSLKAGDDRGKNIRDFAEPIGASARLYVKDLGLAEAAFELGIDDPKKLETLIQNNRRLRELGLGPLLNGGRIKREVWGSLAFALSLFHNVSKELGLGTPHLIF